MIRGGDSLKKTYLLLLLAAAIAAISSLLVPQSAQAQSATHPRGMVVQIKAPLGLPPVPIPADNPPTAETISLGRRLYFDPILSADGSVSCATCHAPGRGFTDNKPVSNGVEGKTGSRNSPTVINSAYSPLQFWDGRAPNLEEQAKGPIANPVEMAYTLDGAVKALQHDASYREDFQKAWGTDQITIDLVAKSIASFERTVLGGNSPFDRYYYAGDKKAMSPSAVRGLKMFMDANKGNCAACHTVDKKYALFSDGKFHNVGVGVDLNGNFADTGRFAVSKNVTDTGAFRTPTLRNIAQTAPYMHDGSLKTLKDVIDHYIGGGNSNPHLDRQIKVLDFLSGQERADLEAFLNSLTGELPASVAPPLPAEKKTAQLSRK